MALIKITDLKRSEQLNLLPSSELGQVIGGDLVAATASSILRGFTGEDLVNEALTNAAGSGNPQIVDLFGNYLGDWTQGTEQVDQIVMPQ